MASLEALGIKLTQRHVVGFVVAVVAGLLVARVLPMVWGYAHPLLWIVSDVRDEVNTLLMASITFATSLAISFWVFLRS